MSRRLMLLALIVPAALAVWPPSPTAAQEAASPGRRVKKTDAEWQKVLTREQFLVTRRKATEPPFSGKYSASHVKGTFACVCCGAPLFNSQSKFDSGTGWPSFWKPIDPKRIDTARDLSLGEVRIEVMCKDCGAHLGHVFDDGPPPTGLRYCINSASLKLLPSTAAKKVSSAKAKKGKTQTPPPEPTDAPETATAQAGESKPAESKDSTGK